MKKLFRNLSLVLFVIVLTLALTLLFDSCNKDTTECIRCKMVGGAVSGGNPSLFPQQEDYCGTTKDVKNFQDDYNQRATAWKNSWTWYGASSWNVQCDKY